MTRNYFDENGLMTFSIRDNIYGYPKENYSIYQYARGDMTRSWTFTDRDTTVNNFDQDGLMRHSVRTRIWGYPRVETTDYQYNEIGSMTTSSESDENGNTQAIYNEDELMTFSERHNTYGHARDQQTSFFYDDEGFMTSSKESDLRGVTVSLYNRDSLTPVSGRFEKFGLYYTRDTISFNYYDNHGFLQTSLSKNLYQDSERWVDKDGLTRKNESFDRYGLGGDRHKITLGYQYDEHGRMQSSVQKDNLSATLSQYDINGDATFQERISNLGLIAGRDSQTNTKYDSDTGMTTWSQTVSAYSTSTSLEYDMTFGLQLQNECVNNFGLLDSRDTTTSTHSDPCTGLALDSFAHNDLGDTTTYYDALWGGTYGTARYSSLHSYYGLGYASHTFTDMRKVDTWNGQNQLTIATAHGDHGEFYSQTTTDQFDQQYGTALHSTGYCNYGVNFARGTDTTMVSNPYNGLSVSSYATCKYSDTTTLYESEKYGTPTSSDATIKYGLGYSRRSITSPMRVNISTGMTEFSESTSSNQDQSKIYSVTDTTVYDPKYGTAMQSHTSSKIGTMFSRETDTTNTPNYDTGLNISSVATNAMSTTTTQYRDTDYGTAKSTDSTSNYGLNWSRRTVTDPIKTNPDTGLNVWTKATSESVDGTHIYSVTTTDQFDSTYGTPQHSYTDSNFGLILTLHTDTQITANTDTGMNKKTFASNGYSDTTTYYDSEEYGLAHFSHAIMKYGLGFNRCTNTRMKASHDTGLNYWTKAKSMSEDESVEYSTTTTDQFDPTYGVALHSHTTSKFGLISTYETDTSIVPNYDNGLNVSTTASNPYSTTTTQYDSGQYGYATGSHTVGNYGLLYSQISDTVIQASAYNGLNTWTQATAKGIDGTVYSVTTTDQFDPLYGVAQHSTTACNFGLGLTRGTDTQIHADTNNGLNKDTTASNGYSVTTTQYDHDRYGTAQSSHANNFYGIGYTRVNDTEIHASNYNGLNTWTQATSKGTDGTIYSVSTTDQFDPTYGTTMHSYTDSQFGIGFTRHTDTTVVASANTGLNEKTVGTSAFGVTTTYFDTVEPVPNNWSDGTYGMAVKTVSDNFYGLNFSRHTETYTLDADHDTGLNRVTQADSLYCTTTTIFDTALEPKPSWSSDRSYGIAAATLTQNKWGLISTRDTTAWMTDVDVNSGLTEKSFSTNAYSDTWTTYDTVTHPSWSPDGRRGMAAHVESHNKVGLNYSRVNITDTNDADTDTGFNKDTFATAQGYNGTEYSTTHTYEFDQTYGTATKSHTHTEFGLGASAETENVSTPNFDTGINLKSVASNDYGTTTTDQYDQEYGTAQHSFAQTNYGLGMSRYTSTDIFADKVTGVNQLTYAVARASQSGPVFSETTTDQFDPEYGTAQHSWTFSHYGLILNEISSTSITASPDTGINQDTFATTLYGTTETDQFDPKYGTAIHTIAKNNFGVNDGRMTQTTNTPDHYTGLNTQTDATTTDLSGSVMFNHTTTDQFDPSYGVARHSVTTSYFGLNFSSYTDTTMDPSTDTGINQSSVAVARASKDGPIFSTTTTDQYNAVFGTAEHSTSVSEYGLGSSKTTDTSITANHYTGLNTETWAVNANCSTLTTYDDWAYGLARESWSYGNYGLVDSRDTYSSMIPNEDNGLNEQSDAYNAYGHTTTWYDSAQSGTAWGSYSQNNYGLQFNAGYADVYSSEPRQRAEPIHVRVQRVFHDGNVVRRSKVRGRANDAYHPELRIVRGAGNLGEPRQRQPRRSGGGYVHGAKRVHEVNQLLFDHGDVV